MRWYRNLYLGPNAAQSIHKIRKKAASKKVMAGVYYVTLSSGTEGLLDIFHNGMLSQSVFEKLQCTDVVGVAIGRQEAFRLTQRIVQEIYGQTGGFNIRSYFKEEDFEDVCCMSYY